MESANTPHFEIFTLSDFWINPQDFIDYLRPTFTALHLDPYDAKRDKVAFLKSRFPAEASRLDAFLSYFYAGEKDLQDVLDLIRQLGHADIREFDRIGMTGRRKRAIAGFTMTALSGRPGDWYFDRHPVGKFVQDLPGHDVRKLVRTFHEADPGVAEWDPMKVLMSGLADKIRAIRPCQILKVSLHQVQIYADALSVGDNAPEGIHRDGADFIVSALVLERAGIRGGESIIYAPDKQTELLRHVLQPGEGIFQEDRQLWHDVTKITEDPTVEPRYGHRSVIGFDFIVVR